MTNLTAMSNHNSETPVMRYHNTVAARVLDRHNLTNDQLAREAQLDPSHISRVLSGERVLSPEVLRALWTLTRDPELLVAITGDPSITIVADEQGDAQSADILTRCVVTTSYILHKSYEPLDNDDARVQRAADLDRAIQALSAHKRQLLTQLDHAPTSPTQRPSSSRSAPYRTVSHPSGKFDAVA
jgi:transcriptional regulator with XRE-family HTH domain